MSKVTTTASSSGLTSLMQGATGFEKQIVTMNPTNGKFPEDCTIRTLVPATGADEGHASGPANYTASPDWAPQKRTGYKPTTFTLPMMSLPTHLRSLCPDF